MDEQTREALADIADALGFAASRLTDLAENPVSEEKISEPPGQWIRGAGASWPS